MMTYRKLPRGEERISTLGLGMGGIQNTPPNEIEAVVRQAIEHGINFFDLCAGGAAVYAPFGRAIEGVRDKVYFQRISAQFTTKAANTAGRATSKKCNPPLRGSWSSSKPIMWISAFCTAWTS